MSSLSIQGPSEVITESLEGLNQSYKAYEALVGQLGEDCSSGHSIQETAIEERHLKITKAFQTLQTEFADFANLCKTVSTSKAPKRYEIYEENMESFEQSTELQARVSKLFMALNHTIRTNYPLAKITELDDRVGGVASVRSLSKPPKTLESFSHFRKILGDGNCFYTSFAVRYLETAVKENRIGELLEFIESKQDGVKNPKLRTFLIATLTRLQQDPSNLGKLLKDNQFILIFVKYLRSIVESEMLSNQEEYAPTFAISLMGDFPREQERILEKDYAQLVKEYVSSMGKDATNISISILCAKLNFPCRIYSEGLPKPVDAVHGKEPKAIFVRASEHYFVVYSEADKVRVEGKEGKMKEHKIKEGKQKEHKSKEPQRAGSESPPRRDDDDDFSLGALRLSPSSPAAALPPAGPPKTVISVRYKVPQGKSLYIRGEGSSELNWDKGIKMRPIGNDIWVWESAALDASKIQFKILLNDKKWEKHSGNHAVKQGQKADLVLKF